MADQSAQHNRYALAGRVALATGGTGALGQAVVRVLLDAGARVVATRHEAPAQPGGPHATGHQARMADDERLSLVSADLTDEPAVERLIQQIVAQHARLDIVMNTVGGYRAGQPVTELDAQTWQAMLTLNLQATFFVSKHAARVMARQRYGRIVNVSSRAALAGRRNAAAYAVSKAGVITLTEVQAEELRDEGVTVNAVLPSIIDTPTNRQAIPSADTSRWPTPEEVARVMAFLASDDASIISGASIPVYGRA
jgi:NAD(P)-dependent dehydrogenase (short-subunit alcohol dehydrogenase family)